MASRFLLRRIIGSRYPAAHQLRSVKTDTQQKITTIEISPTTKVATLTMNRLPANALNLELLRELRSDIERLEQSSDCRGLILTSSSERIFCAGLDLHAVYRPDVERLTAVWLALQNLWRSLFGSRLPTVALINGHATAGGCMLATACDYRLMLPDFAIGLNETKAGVAVPSWVMDSYVNVLRSRRRAEADLIEGRLYRSAEALQIGLIDEVVADKASAMQRAEKWLTDMAGLAREARAQTKLQFRADILHDFEADRERDLERFLSGVQHEEVQAFLGEYLSQLGSKRRK